MSFYAEGHMVQPVCCGPNLKRKFLLTSCKGARCAFVLWVSLKSGGVPAAAPRTLDGVSAGGRNAARGIAKQALSLHVNSPDAGEWTAPGGVCRNSEQWDSHSTLDGQKRPQAARKTMH